MPRRKQQAPKRAAEYGPEDGPEQPAEGGEALEDEDPAADHRLQMDSSCPRPGPPTPGPESDQDACLTDLSSHDLDSESHLSEPSDRMSDFGDSVKSEEVAVRGSRKRRPGAEDSGSISPSSLEQMKAIYGSFLTNSYWSALGIRQPGSESIPCTTTSPANPSTTTTTSTTTTSSSSNGSTGGSTGAFDWHQSAMAKTLQQQVPPGALPLVLQDAGLVSSIHLQRQSTKLYGSIFTGASRFRCKGCSLAFDTLVELTVHMNETGHYRDDNHARDGSGAKCWSKPRKRSLLELEGKDDAQKVLRCMYCGHSFESLQDLSVHMIKTKHYQKVPLKEPMPCVAAKMVAQSRKRLPVDLDFLVPRSKERTPKEPGVSRSHKEKLPEAGAVVTNNHHGNQNGGSGGAWPFDSHKSQILKCMECGASHESLQDLTAHMVVTGHFIKVNNIAMKKSEVAPSSGPTSPTEDKSQTVALPPSSLSSPASLPSPCMSPPSSLSAAIKQEDPDSKHSPQEDQRVDKASKYNYLTEEDLRESPKGGSDILKCLENAVSSAIHKAQTGSPSWGGYQSIHAAYQLPSSATHFQGIPGRSSALRCPAVTRETLSLGKSQALTSPASSHSPASPACQSVTSEANKSTPSSLVPPSCQPVNLQAMQELVKRVTEKMAKVEKQMRPVDADALLVTKESPTADSAQSVEAADQGSHKDPQPKAAPEQTGSEQPSDTESNAAEERSEPETESQMTDLVRSPRPALDASTAIITTHAAPEQPFVNPLSALQSVMNLHLGKVAKPAMREADPMSMLFRMSNSMADKVAVATPLPANSKKTEPCVESFQEVDKDQPIDLSKGKSDRPRGCLTASPTSAALRAVTCPAVPPSQPPTHTPSDRPLDVSEAFQESALADISDMVRNLTQSHAVAKATKHHSGRLERSGGERGVAVATPEDAEEDATSHRRKGRQSTWNVQHLLILQAQFTASLRRSAEGKYVPPDLSLKERTHISHATGLSMTTISHWLANVKYQLRRSGRTKFLKNLDSGQPAFFCSQCSTQVQTPAAYVRHLEAHLGFSLTDLAKLSGEKAAQQLRKQAARSSKAPADSKHTPSHLPSLHEEGKCVLLGCKFCKQTFTNKHALRLHTCHIHGRTEDLPPKGLKMET
ncbi:teashirt homolog 3-like [Sardina pilchardus]|uniref:teashirt homolog 3-like n=1 Tax=Sardina pilchardus TaxID=27697 RepID=UPI002E139EE5